MTDAKIAELKAAVLELLSKVARNEITHDEAHGEIKRLQKEAECE